ncbi:hypothetical protein TanjilG_32260 [Lupinus angustifolius]|uniref:Uncharacterized protein n=1 Tax=Lupinus angustifolius TaxID=3871 RepID=A0A4P1RF13_LUPAN|nr:hypothetical protein TanjilG_32260 [Lupinus angustifolius]
MINAIIFAVSDGSRKPASADIDKVFVFPSIFEAGGETQEGILEYETDDDEVNENGDEYCKSQGYNKDEGVDYTNEITKQEEYDDNLKTRIENFIAKVYKGWIEEKQWDKYNYGLDI